MADNLAALTSIAPISGAYMIGQQAADNRAAAELDRQKTLQDVLAAKQKYGYDEQNNPLLLDQHRTQNVGYGLDNVRKSQDNTIQAGTMQSGMDATNAKNQADITASHIKQAQEFEDRLSDVAAQLPNIDPAMRGAYMSQALAASGMDVNHPQVQRFAQQLASNPAQVAAVLDDARKRRAELTGEFIRTQAHQRLVNEGQKENHEIQARSAENVANINAKAKTDSASIRSQKVGGLLEQYKAGKIKLPELPNALEQLARDATSEEDRDYYLAQAYKANKLLLDRGNARAQPDVKDGTPSSTTPETVYGKEKPKVGTAANPIVLK